MEPPWLPWEEDEEGMPDEPPPLAPPLEGMPPLERLPPLDPPLGMLLEEPPEEPPPLEPDEPPEDPDEPPLGMLDGIDEEEDCCWGHPPMSKADTEPTSTHCTASVSRRFDVGDGSGPAA
jgi:hypothetical protein